MLYAFLVGAGAQETVPMLRDGGRIIAMNYAPGGRTGSWQPWLAMGAAKAALEVLCRYFAVALAPRQFTVNAISPGLDRRQRVEHSAGSGTELHSELAPERMDSHAETRHAGRPRKCRRAALFGGSELDHRTNPGCGWRRVAHGCAPPEIQQLPAARGARTA